MLKKILLTVLILVGLFLAYALFKASTIPNNFHVERASLIKASPEIVYAHIQDLKKWQKWSPWAELDPNQKTTYGPKSEGDGAYYEWDGNDQVGKGRLGLNNCLSTSHVGMDLKFIEPFESVSTGGFKINPSGEATKVTWYYDQKVNSFFEKMMFGVMGFGQSKMDEMLGKDFEKGLSNIKKITEAEMAATPSLPTTPSLPQQK